MDVKFTVAFKNDPSKKIEFKLDEPITSENLDTLRARKTREFLDLFAEDFPIDPVPPAYQIPVLRGKFRR